jgi:hypothetical protein
MAKDKAAPRTPPTPPARPHRARLEAVTPDAAIDMGYRALTGLRRAAFREHARTLETDDSRAWAAQMAAAYGDRAKVWHNALPWDVAYLVARYGEDVAYWPTSYSEADYSRMGDFLADPQVAAGVRVLGTRRTPLPGETLHGLDDPDDDTADPLADPPPPIAGAGDAATPPDGGAQ